MSIFDTFTHGFVRKVAYILAALACGFVLSLAGIGNAKAQAFNDAACNGPGQGDYGAVQPLCSTREIAYASVVAARDAYIAGTNPATCAGGWCYQPIEGVGFQTSPDGNWGRYEALMRSNDNSVSSTKFYRWFSMANQCPAGGQWSDATKKCDVPCSSKPNLGPRWIQGTSDAGSSSMCHENCEYVGSLDAVTDQTTVDGIRYTRFAAMTPWGNSCTTGNTSYGTEVAAPPADSDGDGSSDGNDTAPSNPGQGAGGGEEPGGEDGGQPGEGSGNGNTSSGGGDCGTPPNSHGDQIAAQIAYQAWATRCAVERSQDEDGNVKTKETSGTGTGTGTGGGGTGGLGTCAASEVGTVLCTMKEAIAGIKGFLDGIGEEAGTLDQGDGEGENEDLDTVWADQEGTEVELDASGFGLAGGSCPAPPTYMGHSLDLGGNMCLFATIIGAIVLAAAYAQAAYIIGRA